VFSAAWAFERTSVVVEGIYKHSNFQQIVTNNKLSTTTTMSEEQSQDTEKQVDPNTINLRVVSQVRQEFAHVTSLHLS
jgi:hypothetical protein